MLRVSASIHNHLADTSGTLLQEQRKVWEDHRRRSVYLEEKTAAAEKAAEEANRRHSQLLYSMALNSAAPFPPHPVASLAMWNQASTSTEAKQGNNWHLAQEHAAAGKRG